MTCPHIYRLCLAAFGVFVAASAYEYLCFLPSESALVVNEPDRTLPEVIVDREYVIDFRIHNCDSQTLRVVGMEFT